MFAMPVAELNGVGNGAGVTGNTFTGAPLAQLINFHGGWRQTQWRFDLLTNTRAYKSDLTPFVVKAVIQHDVTRAIHRTCTLDMVETAASQTVTVTGSTITSAGVDYINDFCQPVMLIKSPGGWLHFPMGVFRFTRPGVQVPGYAVVRTATMPDLSSVLQDAKAIDSTNSGVGIPLTLPPGMFVIDIITALIQNATSNVQSNPATTASLPGAALGNFLPSNVAGAPAGNTPGDWPTSATVDAKIPPAYTVTEGMTYLDLINRLLFTMGYYDLMADHNGVFRIQKWPPNQDYTVLSSQYTYDTTTDSIVSFGMTEDIMLDNVYNVVEVIIEDGYRGSFKATARNDDAASPYSVANFGYKVSPPIRDPQVPDVGVSGANYAQMYAKQQLLMASWLTDAVTLPTAVNPLHAGGMDHDVVSLNIYQQYIAAGSAQNVPVIVGITIPAHANYPALISSEKFLQDGWTITANLVQPGAGGNIAGNVGLTTMLEPRDQKMGHTMSQTLHRITSTIRTSQITVT